MRRLASAVRALSIAGAGLLAPVAFACGFEDPAAMQTGFLNWEYPNALYVDTAVWRAQLDGRIETDPPLQTTNLLLVNPGFRKAMKTLEDFTVHLAGDPDPQHAQSFVVLFMEAMLWSRFEIGDGDAKLYPHIKAAADGETVVITHRVVLEAINRGALSAEEARRLGLMRLYGDDAAIAKTMAVFKLRMGANQLGSAAP